MFVCVEHLLFYPSSMEVDDHILLLAFGNWCMIEIVHCVSVNNQIHLKQLSAIPTLKRNNEVKANE